MLNADNEVWRQLHERIEELRNDILHRMAMGGCQSWEQYQHAVGYVRALDAVVGAAQDIFGRTTGHQFEEAEEDE